MKKISHIIFALYFVVPCAYASQSAINNVQNYSSSPFYDTGGVYNQKFPTPVYVKGAALSAAECLSAVNSAIWTQCSFQNNCVSVSLADVRPGILMELANKTDNNYNACAGYIDSAFAEFKKMATGSVTYSNFPTATKQANYGTNGTIDNPFTYWNQVSAYEYQQKARQYQLENMKNQNGPLPVLQVEKMPETFSDVGFRDRMNVEKQGWQDPAVDHQTYGEINIESDLEKRSRLQALENAQAVAAAEEAAPKK